MAESSSDETSRHPSKQPSRVDSTHAIRPPETVAGYIGGGWGITLGGEEEETKLPTIPGYTVLREIGRGASAVVFEATDDRLHRNVAIKMLFAAGFVSAAQLHRFKTEALTVAKLSHPNIVQIFEVGEHSGIPFFVMELLEKDSLLNKIHAGLNEPRQSAEWVEALARAVHHAHQHGVIHRDIKPANVLFTATGTAKIADFGVAKSILEAESHTRTGDVVGTPAYMAPEQAAGHIRLVGPPVDVYALGALLFEMIAGRPPFRGTSPVDTLMQIKTEEAPRPSQFRPGIPTDLETIALMCLEKEMTKRYASAAHLADDLRRFLDGHPILAVPSSPWDRTLKWSRRNPMVAGLLGLIVLLTSVGLLVMTFLWINAANARDDLAVSKLREVDARIQAEQTAIDARNARLREGKERERAELERNNALAAKSRAETLQHSSEQNLYYSRIALAELRWRNNDIRAAKLALEQCIPKAGEIDFRGWEWHYLKRLLAPELAFLPDHLSVVRFVAWMPDGENFITVVGDPDFEANIRDAVWEIKIRNWRTKEVVSKFEGHLQGIEAAALSADGKFLLTGGGDTLRRDQKGEVVYWDIAAKKAILKLEGQKAIVESVAISRDATVLAGAWCEGEQTKIQLWEASTGKPIRTLTHGGTGPTISFGPRFTLASHTLEDTCHLWDATEGKIIRTFRTAKERHALAFSNDGKQFAIAGPELKVYDLDSDQAPQVFRGHAGRINGVAFSPIGDFIATCGSDATVRTWDLTNTGGYSSVYRGHLQDVGSVGFSPDGSKLVSGGNDAIAIVWNATTGPSGTALGWSTPVREGANDIAWTSDSKSILLTRIENPIYKWDMPSRELSTTPLAGLKGRERFPFNLLCFSPDQRYVIGRVDPFNFELWMWDRQQPYSPIRLKGYPAPLLAMAFNPTGKYIVSATASSRTTGKCYVKIWDVQTRKERSHFFANEKFVRAVAMNSAGTLIAVAGGPFADENPKKILILDATTGKPVKTLECSKGLITWLQFFDNDKKLLALDFRESEIHRWELSTDRQIMPVLTTPAGAQQSVFSPDGSRIASAGRDSVRLWDAATGQDIVNLNFTVDARVADYGFNPMLAFSPDGNWLAATHWRGGVTAWDGRPAKIAGSPKSELNESNWHLWQAAILEERGYDDWALKHLKQIGNGSEKEQPSSRRKVTQTAKVLTKLGRWKEALAEYQKYDARNELDALERYDFAVMQFLNHEKQGLTESVQFATQNMLENPVDELDAAWMKIVLLAGLDGSQFEKCQTIANNWLNSFPMDRTAANKGPAFRIAALAALRMKNFPKALQYQSEAFRNPNELEALYELAFRALVAKMSGAKKEQQELLEKANAKMQSLREDQTSSQFVVAKRRNQEWRQWLECLILLEQAKSQ